MVWYITNEKNTFRNYQNHHLKVVGIQSRKNAIVESVKMFLIVYREFSASKHRMTDEYQRHFIDMSLTLCRFYFLFFFLNKICQQRMHEIFLSISYLFEVKMHFKYPWYTEFLIIFKNFKLNPFKPFDSLIQTMFVLCMQPKIENYFNHKAFGILLTRPNGNQILWNIILTGFGYY